MIILRYLSKEIAKTAGAVVAILLLVALLNKFSSLIAKSAAGDLPLNLLFKFIGLQIPELVAFLAPLGLFLGFLLALGKLYSENEMTAYFACGLGWKSLVKVGLTLGTITLFLTALLTLWCVPYCNQLKEEILAKEEPLVLLKTLSPGKFHQIKSKDLVFYVEKLGHNRTDLKRIFIAEEPKSSPEANNLWTVLSATSGKLVEKDGFRYLKLQNGHRYEGLPGNAAYQILNFKIYERLIETKPNTQVLQYHRNTSTVALFHTHQPSYVAELQWRMATPIAGLILALWGLGLAKVPPRKGRFGKILPGAILFIFYFNLLTVSKRWVASAIIPPVLGLWWVHVLFLVLAIGLLLHSSGAWRRKNGK